MTIPAVGGKPAGLRRVAGVTRRRGSGLPVAALAMLGVIVLLLGLLISRPKSAGATARTVDGLAVLTVAQTLAARQAGTLGTSVAVGGYWSSGVTFHGCAASPAGELEIPCHDGEYGITDLAEEILALGPAGAVRQAQGPHLTPFVPDTPAFQNLFALPQVNGQQFPPVPIVVVGHFDDPRAANCQPNAVAACRDRFVLDRVVTFDPSVVATPQPSPSPTPFPSPAPPGLFDPTTPGVCAGDVPYSFVGWTTTSDLSLPFTRPGHVWAAVTADAVLLGGAEFTVDPESSQAPYRWWGRRICVATETDPNVVLYGAVPGSTYQETKDGTRTKMAIP